jgi:integrase/recombinase XerD
MSEKPISPLRRRMIEDMTVRNFVEKTHNDYIRHVRTFTTFLGRAPDTAAPEDLRLFQLHQTQTGVGASGINGSVAALRFFFTVTLDRPEMARHLTFVREPRKIPVILSLEEIARLLEAAPGPKYKAALSAAYGAGLRVSEVVALKVSDIDSERMLLHIEQSKGRKDRFAMRSPRLLELLRDWYRIARPAVWLFPGRDPLLPLTLPISPACRSAGRILSTSHPRSSSAPPSNPHSARCPAAPAGAPNLPRLRALALFGRRPPQRVERFVIPASKKLHRFGLMHRSKQLRLFDHIVGAGEQKMRDCDLAELTRREESKFPEGNLRMSDRDHPKALLPRVNSAGRLRPRRVVRQA